MPRKPRKHGGQPGNKNALKNGTRVRLKRLVVGELPSQMIAIKREGRTYRRQLEAQVLAMKGEINTTDCHLIDTASAATIQAGIARWLLRHRIDQMDVDNILKTGDVIVKAKTVRDRAVRELKLDKAQDPWQSLYDGTLQNDGDKSKTET